MLLPQCICHNVMSARTVIDAIRAQTECSAHECHEPTVLSAPHADAFPLLQALLAALLLLLAIRPPRAVFVREKRVKK